MLNSKRSRTQLLSVLLSAMMALPPQVWADNSVQTEGVQHSSQTGVGTDAIPVAISNIVTPDGQPGEMVVVGVPVEAEASLVRALVNDRPDRLQLFVSGLNDRVYKIAKSAGSAFKKVTTFVLGEPENSDAVNQPEVPESLKQKVKQKFANYRKSGRFGLMIAIMTYSATNAGYTIYQSSSVPAGAMVFSALFIWSMILANNPKFYHSIVQGAGLGVKSVVGAISRWLGHELTENEEYATQVVGNFAATMAMAAGVATVVDGFSGQVFNGDHSLGYDTAKTLGAAARNNYSFWDALMLRLHDQSAIGKIGMRRYYFWQYILGGGAEVLGYMGTPGTAVLMTGVTLAGVMFQLFHPNRQDSIGRRFKNMAKFFSKTPCEKSLLDSLNNRNPVHIETRVSWGDVQ